MDFLVWSAVGIMDVVLRALNPLLLIVLVVYYPFSKMAKCDAILHTAVNLHSCYKNEVSGSNLGPCGSAYNDFMT